jgi:ATP-dependent DNA helicase RecG
MYIRLTLPISFAVKLNTEPKLYPQIEKIELKNKTCILVTVEESPLKPHLAYGRVFLRVGTTNQRLDLEQYEYMLQQRSNGYGFDYQIEKKATLDDIDPDLVYQFLEIANTVRDINQNMLLPMDVILQNLELMKDTGITRAALLLFGKKPQKFFPDHYEIKCGHFTSDEGYDEISNDKEFNRNLIENFHLSLGFVRDSIKKRAVKI